MFIERFFDKFSKDDTTTLAASLAFYTALSLAPLLILFVTISAQFSDHLQHNFVTEVRSVVGVDASKAIEMVIDSAKDRPDLTSLASAMGVLTLLISASLIFGQLRTTLNRIFDVKVRSSANDSLLRTVWQYLKERIFHVGLALSFIFTLIVSLVISSMISATIHNEKVVPMMVLNVAVNIVFYILLFTLLFRFLPDRRLPWRRAAQGGTLTSVLFVVGKELIGIYLGNSAVGSSYGAAGSVIVLLVWVYYSALITFVGAQVSWLLHHSRRRTNEAQHTPAP
jgi:membrane protein